MIAAVPKAMRTIAATIPPTSKNLRISRLLSIRGAFRRSVGRRDVYAIRGLAQAGGGCSRF
jgi:hypothetical protein